MSYTNPAFMVAHPASELNATTAITALNITGLDDQDRRALVDRRQGASASWTNGTDQRNGAVIDFGTPIIPNRVVVPKDHNLPADTACYVLGCATSTFDLGTYVNDGVGFATVGEPIDIEVGAFFGDPYRYWVVTNRNFSSTIEFSETWLGTRNVLTAAVAVDIAFTDEYRHEVSQQLYGGGLSTLELSPPRRFFSLSVRNVDATSADWDTLEEVIRDGRAAPFWYWPPDTDAGGPFLVNLERSATRVQEFPAPQQSIFYQVDLEMVESLA